MRFCNDTVTVFSARVDPDVGGQVWTPTVITGAHWWATDASTVDTSKGGMVAANKVIVRIPLEAAPAGLKVKNGDIVVKAAVTGSNWTPVRLKNTYAEDCAVVLGITDNRQAPNAPHIKVVAS